MCEDFYDLRPQADPQSIITIGSYRVTVLTSRCLRIEFSPNKTFQDSPTLTFTVREQPVPKIEPTITSDSLELKTSHLGLVLRGPDDPPTADSLRIWSLLGHFEWKYGDKESHNLRGTTRTLDEVTGSSDLSDGLNSRDGYTIVNDSKTPIITSNGLFRSNSSELDLYFFGYFHDYNSCISDFLKLSGQSPLLPRYVYGNWWSRWWPYSARDILNVVDSFSQHEVDLSVFVLDMDWHIVKTDDGQQHWTGYTFERTLIPDPPVLLQTLHNRGLHVTMNLHPASGIGPHEDQYEEFAKRRGIQNGRPIKFDSDDQDFMKSYFELLHHPHESIGVDFWWIDWQQESESLVDPLIVLNHQHFADIGRDRSKRSLILSRWCGLGGHRYPIGFSGDTTVEWASLQFQPYFSATAANVGFSFWSHDIGGHFGGYETGELFVRWLQLGALLPILRLHSNRNRFHSRMPWNFGIDAEFYGCAALRFHTELIPLMYSLGYRVHLEGVQLVRPLYFLWPEDENAYNCPTCYLLGDDIIVSPFVTPIDRVTGVATTAVWLPPGDVWFDFQTSRQYVGGWHLVVGDLARIPVFVRAGGLVPTEVKGILTVHVFPSGSRSFDLYEDDGETLNGGFHVTKFSTIWDDGNDLKVVIESVGDRSVIPQSRKVTLKVHNISGDATIKLSNCQLAEKRTQLNGCVILTLQILDYPATINLNRTRLLVIPHARWTGADIYDLIQPSSLTTAAKDKIFNDLTQKKLSPKSYAEVIAQDSELPPAIQDVLYGVLCGCGAYSFTQDMGKKVLIVWNTEHIAEFTYVSLFTDYQAKPRYRQTSGEVPSSLIYEIDAHKSKYDAHNKDLAIRKSRIEFSILGCPVFPVDFDKL